MIEINHNPPPKDLRIFSTLLAIFLAFFAWKFRDINILPGVLTTAAALSLLGAIAFPRAMRYPYLTLTYLTFPIGFIISHLILALIWYGLVTPLGLIMRIFGYDPMHKKIDPHAETYWAEHNPAGEPARYFRQF